MRGDQPFPVGGSILESEIRFLGRRNRSGAGSDALAVSPIETPVPPDDFLEENGFPRADPWAMCKKEFRFLPGDFYSVRVGAWGRCAWEHLLVPDSVGASGSPGNTACKNFALRYDSADEPQRRRHRLRHGFAPKPKIAGFSATGRDGGSSRVDAGGWPQAPATECAGRNSRSTPTMNRQGGLPHAFLSPSRTDR
ncbi:MAG: hypothetical protein JWN86_944 [Planctomycetota bacterium]|nr:hypothetical protein [Planctomycetota bacterium]